MKIAMLTDMAGPAGNAVVGEDPYFLTDAEKAALVEAGFATMVAEGGDVGPDETATIAPAETAAAGGKKGGGRK